MPDAEGLPARPGVRVWEVAALVHAVGDALASRFGSVAVRGELGGFSRATSGHCYFTLKDADGSAALRCAMFRRAASLVDFAPQDGAQVELRGRLAVYEPRGELQFIVESMRRSGAGALYERFLRLRAQLEAEGLFDADRKQAVPGHPRCIGVVTSPAAAALQDVLIALQRRSPHIRVVIYPCAVQGSDAANTIAAVIALATERAEVDTLIVCRGGGSLEDLWTFNEAGVVRAIAACPLPVIVGVGHETDVTLADLVADLRAPTPTAAAELAAPVRAELLEALSWLDERVARGLRHRLDAQAQRLDRIALRLGRPAQALAPHRGRLDLLSQGRRNALARQLVRCRERQTVLVLRLAQARARALSGAAQRLALLNARLQALDPRQVLARGYAWIGDEAGRPLGSVSQVQAGQTVRARLVDGELSARVSEVRPSLPEAGS